ncbi:11047_t:CDS:2 [Acaulospora colombiana]|uniref:11047_t:CDS:1 n=1 Tax=Acaulospora colombiana TaxID=27376 RepID=A0ACA9KXN4_9GLOM|nr:11047_t:CDS:2 [Acaulospora colombiana]
MSKSNITSPLGLNFRSFYSLGSHVSISPDGQKIVTFEPETKEFKIFDVHNTTQHSSKFTYNTGESNSNQTTCWSLAISNCTEDTDRLIALSRFDPCDILHKDSSESSLVDEEMGTTTPFVAPRTWIFSESTKTEIPNSFQNIGGIVRFLENDMEIADQTQIVAINASGIYKATIKTKISNIHKHFYVPTFLHQNKSGSIEHFYLPRQLSINLSSLDRWESGFMLLHTSIIRNHFLICDYKNQHQAVEMYSLITGDLEMVFRKREPPNSPDVPKGKRIFAISKNEAMLAFCRGTSAITIYLMENGLEVITKEVEKQGFVKIVSLDFVADDNKLLIVFENEGECEKGENENRNVFIVWDLFSTSDNAIREVVFPETHNFLLNINATHRLTNPQGRILTVTNWDGVFPLSEQPDIVDILNHTPSPELVDLDLSALEDNSIDHLIFDLGGKRDKNASEVIINEIEPWHHDEKYLRIFANLDDPDKTQLIIGPNTVQVWKIIQDKRILEFIWSKKSIGKSRICINRLQIGRREFVLTLSTPSSKKGDVSKTRTIHWPNNENTLKSACRALKFLVNKKKEATGNCNANRCEYLIKETQRLIGTFIKKHSLFRSIDIRYNIMKDLIEAQQEPLIRNILSKDIEGTNGRLHIPRLYEWINSPSNIDGNSTYAPKLRSKVLTDLQCAIEKAKNSVSSAKIVEHLLEYYTDNAGDFNNPGWMFTVTGAIPYLYRHDLGKHFFSGKPCFGTTEAYSPPLHIRPEEQKAGNNTESVYVVNARPGLERKPEVNILEHHEKDPDFYNVPSMDAVTDFKWTNAKEYFARQVTIYILFAISFAIRSILYIADAPLQALYDGFPYSGTIYAAAFFSVIYFGYYLLATEIIQIKRNGFAKYNNFYNVFDLVSILAPLITIAIKEVPINIASETFQIILAFTVLVMWMQLLLLMRYFKYAGHYIYIIIHILNTIWPFLAFMLIVVVGFGHAMFVLLHKADPSSLVVDTYGIVNPNNITDNLFPAVFFWTNGRWDQIGQWNNYALDVMTILGSLVLVLIFQNMLIAFMNGAFDSAYEHGRNAVQNFRADLISEYETLEKPFRHKFRNPRYIYYIPNPSVINSWLSEIAKEKKLDDDGDSSDDDDTNSNSGYHGIYYVKSSNEHESCITFYDEGHRPPPPLRMKKSKEIVNTLVGNNANETTTDPVFDINDNESGGAVENEELVEKLGKLEDGIARKIKVMEDGFTGRLENLEKNIKLLLSLMNNR